VILQTSAAVPNLESAVREAFAQSHPDLTLIRMIPMREQVSGNFGLNRLLARLTSAYGVLALALATLGVYGVTAYGVAQRKREIGIRMALGARPGRVTSDVLRGALGQTILGLLIGVPAALGAVSVVSTFLYQVEARDPRVLITAMLVLVASAIAAGVAPARRASRINPIEALRS
jgi:ABC-type antimicrobial peptide transport system permease subunit